MDNKWQEVAGQLLVLAAGKFSNHGCDDWKWPVDWTLEERYQLALAMQRDTVCGRLLMAEEIEDVRGWADGDFGPPDWWVMRFLGKELRKAVKHV